MAALGRKVATEINGTERAQKVSTSALWWYPSKSESVIAIDFGTSTLAVAYRGADGKVNDIKIQDETYVPTYLLIRSKRTGEMVAEIGKIALREYKKANHENAIFFEKVKLELQHRQEVNRTSSVRGSDGKKYYLVEVIGLILKNLKEIIESYFETRGGLCKIEEFDWVITVPALWGERARDMMREAAYVAGLCSNIPKWNKLLKLPLQTVETHEPIQVKEFECNPERLSLVFEPEAAATWCKHLTPDSVQDCGETTGLLTTGCFLTVDIGGGTIDVTAHQVERDGRMKVYNLPCGKICGGTTVNQAFRTFLGKEVVHDEEFETYLKHNKNSNCHAELMTIVNQKFERTKTDFGCVMNVEYWPVEIRSASFVEFYKHKLCLLPEELSDGVDVAFLQSTSQLQLSGKKMKQFMAECLTQIKECIDAAIATIGARSTVHIIYLVGGFGGCRYIAEDIRLYYDRVRVIIPDKQELAVVRGACLYHREGVLHTADATYGTAAMIPYDESNRIHKQRKKVCGADNIYYCMHLFLPFVKIGEELDPDCVYITSYTPGTEEQTSIRVHLYSTKEADIHFVLDKTAKKLTKGLNHLGSVEVNLSNGMSLPRHRREVEIVFDFSSIEIVVYAIFVHTRDRAQVITDFLSTHEKVEHM